MTVKKWVIVPKLVQISPIRRKELPKYLELFGNFVIVGSLPKNESRVLAKASLADEDFQILCGKKDVEFLERTPQILLNEINGMTKSKNEWERFYAV